MTDAQYKQFCEGGWSAVVTILILAFLKAMT